MKDQTKEAGFRLNLVLMHLKDKKGLTQADIAKFLDRTQSRVSTWATETAPAFSRLIRTRLAKLEALGINPEFFDTPYVPMLLKDVNDPEAENKRLREEIRRLKKQLKENDH